MEFLFTRHARQRMIERGVYVSEVEQAVQKGSKQLQAKDRLVSSYGYINVVYRKLKDRIVVITVKMRW